MQYWYFDESDKLRIDVGLSPADLPELVRVGDLVTMKRELVELQGDLVAARRWAERRGFGIEVIDEQPGEEAGIKDPVYAAMIDSTDQGVGRILDKLDELGLSLHSMQDEESE